MSEGFGPLDLSGANTKGFEPLEPAKYNAEIFEVSMDAVKKEGGKMPVGTPMVKVQFKLTDPEFDNRRVFTQFVLPPADYDKKKRDTMNGIFVRFLVAIGEDEKKVLAGKYNPDFEDLKGRECVVTLSKEEYPKGSGEYQNRVKGVKPAGSLVSASSGLL